MNILKRGTPPEERQYQGTCGKCETEIHFLQMEGQVTFDQRDGDFITVVCPVCNESIHVATNKYLRKLEGSELTRAYYEK